MGKQVEQLWMNSVRGLLYKTRFIPSTDTLVGCVGKTVVIEPCEMDTVCIEDKYYEVVGNLHGLDLIREIEDRDYKTESNLKTPSEGMERRLRAALDLIHEEFNKEQMSDLAVELLVRTCGKEQAETLYQIVKGAGDVDEDMWPGLFMESLQGTLHGGEYVEGGEQ